MERPGYRPSPDQERRRKEVFETLEQAVDAIHDSESFRAFLELQSKFHTYSWRNVALILQQRPTASRCAGVKAWNQLGRFVNKGERGLDILAPTFRPGAKKEDQETEAPVGFLPVRTFDVSQTNGKPLPEFDVPVLEGDEGGVLYQSLEGYSAVLGVTVHPLPPAFQGDEMGYYVPAEDRIGIRTHMPDGSNVPQLQQTKTLAHELAHHVGGHGKPRGPEQIRRTRAEEEAIAEACAYVTLSHFGLDSGARSFPYIAIWSKEKGVLKAVLSEVARVSGKIISGVEKVMPLYSGDTQTSVVTSTESALENPLHAHRAALKSADRIPSTHALCGFSTYRRFYGDPPNGADPSGPRIIVHTSRPRQ
jgi:antirestriction protein ArdC